MSELLFQVSEVSLVVPLFEFVALDLLLYLLRLLVPLSLASSIHKLLNFSENLIGLVVLCIIHSLETTCD
jgi:hypothetical protein